MGLTSLSVLLAVALLNVHLYGSALKPVPSRLRQILFHRLAPLLFVTLHRAANIQEQKNPRRSTVKALRRATTIYNTVFLSENDLLSGKTQQQEPSEHTFQSTTINNSTNTNSDSTQVSNIRSTSESLSECKRLLTDLNRLILRPTDNFEEEQLTRDWQNVALVLDRCLLYLYIILTAVLTIVTLVLAPLLKTVPQRPDYFHLNITRD